MNSPEKMNIKNKREKHPRRSVIFSKVEEKNDLFRL